MRVAVAARNPEKAVLETLEKVHNFGGRANHGSGVVAPRFPKARARRAAVREKGEPTAAQYDLIQASVGIRRHDGLLRQRPMLLIRRRPRCSWLARARGLLESSSPLWRPVCFASRKKKAHPFMQEGGQLFLEVLQFLTHQGSHKH
jgi:hypothetical protein